MARITHALVIDDLTYKVDQLKAASEIAKSRNASLDYEITHLHRISHLVDLVNTKGPAALAAFDAVLVDFNLNTTRYREVGELVTISAAGAVEGQDRIDSGDAPHVWDGEVEVDLTTGIGVLLYLAEQTGHPDYIRARQGRPDLITYTYVDLSERTSQYFAPAGWLWFGARVFPVRTAEAMANTIANLGTAPKEQSLVETGAERLADLMDYKQTVGRSLSWLEPGIGHDTNAWLRALHRHNVAYAVEPYRRDGLIARGKLLRPVNVDLGNQLQPQLIDRLNRGLREVVAVFDQRHVAGWPIDGPTPVREALRRELATASEFWTADDIAVALERHRMTERKREAVALAQKNSKKKR